jgi:hypothetical protein
LIVFRSLLPVAAYSQGTSAPADAFLYIIWPPDGTTVKGAFCCRFGLRNMDVTQAGSNAPNSGHHHLLIDVNEPLDPNEPIPQDKTHLHFGKHTLQPVLGDAKHYPFKHLYHLTVK